MWGLKTDLTTLSTEFDINPRLSNRRMIKPSITTVTARDSNRLKVYRVVKMALSEDYRVNSMWCLQS